MALLTHLPAAARLDVLHQLLFFGEGARCTPKINDLPRSKAEAIVCGAGLPNCEAAHAVALMAELLPTVHAVASAHRSTSQEDLS